MNVNNNINSAIVSATLGIQRGFNDVSEAAQNLSNLAAAGSSNQGATREEILTQAAETQLSNVRQTLPQGAGNITEDLVSLQLGARSVQASSKVLDVANDTIGRIIDELV